MPDGRRAVFLDRDGTIVDDPSPGFLHEPGRVRLLPRAAEAIH
ncbi:MAG: D,D-heptose 1,7-bisphosphate phosphatase, partial [Gemmatimonadetes bacterium]